MSKVLLIFCGIFLFSCSKSKSLISTNGKFRGIVVGKSTLEEIERKFGSNYSIDQKNYSVRFVDGESKYILLSTVTYFSKGILFKFFGDKIRKEKVNQIVFLESSNIVTDKGIRIGKNTLKEIIEIHGEPFWYNGSIFEKKLTLSYDGISFIFDKEISKSKLEMINKKELEDLVLHQIKLVKEE